MSGPHWNYRITIGLLPVAMAAGTILYTLVGVLASFIIEDLGITRAQLGWVLGLYAVISALTSPVIGRIADRIGARVGMLAIFAATSVGFAGFAGAPGVLAMIAAAAVVGVGQSLANPATNKMIAHEVVGGRRGLVTGIKQSGVQAGTFVGGVTFPAFAGVLGWRGVPLLLAAALGLVFVTAWWALPHHPVEPGEAPVAAGPLPPSTWWIALYAFLMGLGGSPVFSFLPLYGVEAVGVSEQYAGLIVGSTALIGVFARIAWSIVSERRGEFAGPLSAIAAIAVTAGVATILAEPVGVAMLWVSAILGFLSISAWNSVAMLSVIVEAGARSAGRASGIVLMGFFAGLGLAPPIFGWSVDQLGTYLPGFTAVTLIFALAMLTMLGFRRRQARPIPAEPPARPGS